jgi:1-acyl-sn-glycerol-3-phosphate acyltransferase
MTTAVAAVRLVATAVCFAGFYTGTFLMSWLVVPVLRVVLAGRPIEYRRRVFQSLTGRGFGALVYAMRVLRLVLYCPDADPWRLPDGPFVMIANHPTLVDVAAILATVPEMCCFVKRGLYRSITFGPTLRACGHVCGSGEGLSGGIDLFQEANRRLEQGHPILIFPEGTRSPPFGLRRFKVGAFELAVRNRVPVVPLFVTCTPPTLLKTLRWYRLPKETATLRIAQLPTILPDPNDGDGRGLAKRVQALYQVRIQKWVAGRQPRDDAHSGSTKGTQ